jgi:type II secretory ATPase GspE/PulE/Tfp pilus assembly ATPase PilB-like protein
MRTKLKKNQAAVVKCGNNLIRQALKSRAPDIHFEPQRHSLQIKYRRDRHLVAVCRPSNLVKFRAAIILLLKIAASPNI